MAATFRPVNSSQTPTSEGPREDVMTTSPTTSTSTSTMTTTATISRPSTAPHPQSAPPNEDPTTPTRTMFGAPVAGQKPLPTSPFPQAVQIPARAGGAKSSPGPGTGLGLSLSPDTQLYTPKRDSTSQQPASSPAHTQRYDQMDVDMDESDGEANDAVSSDNESVNADGTRSGKKKKSQRFYCTEYPPCSLSFTRSEHLARHIRKHTGERPFQCHCSRRFSRLDNLRQHAQTVHVNEDIPMDSLAATGSRFQRQIRTDRVRQAGNRARAATGGSAGGPPRGHSKSFSTSSINSVSSVGSAYSTLDASRRPPPLNMAAPPSADYRSNQDGYMYRAPSPSDFSTPTSATFSTGQGSPRWGAMGSPTTSSHSRSQSMYTPGSRTPGRRLSVPSGVNPFQAPHGHAYGRPIYSSHGPLNTSNSGAFSPNSSLVSSPTASTSGWSARRDSTSSASEEAWRRRTWHPDSRSFNGNISQLNNVASQTAVRPEPPPPVANPSSSQPGLQLPGIEAFVAATQRHPSPRQRPPTPPHPPPRQHHSAMMIDSHPGPPPIIHQVVPAEMVPHEERRNLNMYDASLQRGLNRLDISHTTPPRDSASAWALEAHKAVQAHGEEARVNQPTVRFETQPPPTSYPSQGPPRIGPSLHQQTMSAPSISAPRDGKRRGWYNGPTNPQEGEASRLQQDPRATRVDRMVHPNLNGFNGFPSRDVPPSQPPSMPPSSQQHPLRPRTPQATNEPESLRRLEALVAVATSKISNTTTAY